jgi:hypothetical protein
VSFAYPMIPLLFIAVRVWMIIEGVLLKTIISLLTLFDASDRGASVPI